MNFKTKLKSSNFWTGLAAAVFILLRALGVELNAEAQDAVLNAMCALLVVLGIVCDNGKIKPQVVEEKNNINQVEKDDIAQN